MLNKNNLPYLILLSKYTSRILEYTKDMSKTDFENSHVTYDACILNFINIGETLKTLSNSFKEKYPEIEYQKIIGLRNIAAHSYEGIEVWRLYETIINDLPVLHDQIANILKDISGD